MSVNLGVPEAKKSKLNPGESTAPFRVLNIGNSKPVNLMKYIDTIEENLKKKQLKNFYLCNKEMFQRLFQILEK